MSNKRKTYIPGIGKVANHKLYGHKGVGPTTKLANEIFDGTSNALDSVGGALNTVAAKTAGVVIGAGQGAGNALGGISDNALSVGKGFNEWAQGLSDSETGVYPYTAYKDTSLRKSED